jgi:serine/threonine protein kinase
MSAPSSSLAVEFPGTARYKTRRRLGSGAFGVVYEADDTTLGGRVALKLLHRPDGSALARFKHEFRSLAHIKHPNLVALRDLASDGGRWFFTMELIDGVDIVRHVWGGAQPAFGPAPSGLDLDASITKAEVDLVATAAAGGKRSANGDSAAAPPPPARFSLDIPRVRNAFGQLARGVAALHDAGKVHRDIKPSNILVEAGGRVVLLDFGLIAEPADGNGSADLVVGTPAYMAPEQAMGKTDPTSDWYSVGCLLYLALTGRLPVVGVSSIDVCSRKQFETPPPPRLSRPGVPPDLDALCMSLLAIKPTDRPGDAEVLRRLPVEAPAISVAPAESKATSQSFVGRTRELDVLAKAYRSMRDGRANVVCMRGRSGAGKTTLVQRFIQQAARADPSVVALGGRCYERESVPYKALDALVDSLRRYLRRLPKAELAAVLPRNLPALARLFPVLKDVGTFENRRGEEIPDPLELRRCAFAALRDLFSRMADRHRVVVFIDDLQWGDADSIALLLEIVAPPDPPPFLLVLSYRSEDAKTNPQLQELGAVVAGPHLDRADIELGALAESDARALVEQVLADAAGTEPATQTEKILRESAGLPFMLVELASFSRVGGDEADVAGPQDLQASSAAGSIVDALVRARARLLEPAARLLLETICVAGQPLARSTACRAANLEGEPTQASLDALAAARLVRSRGAADAWELEAFHDRIREAVTAGLAPDVLAARHAAIADALEAEPDCDPERLSAHLCAAGHVERARAHVERAADRASSALAFARAVRLYRLALELSGSQPSRRVQTKLADALANGGYGGEAGRAYLAAIPGAAPEEALDLRRRAAEQFLRSGHVDEALPAVERVLADVGLRIPATPGLSLASLLFQRAKLKFRGLGFAERREVPVDELRKIDVCWALGNGMGGLDVIRGADFQARHLLLALRAGEPYRIARALAWESVLSSIEGGAAGHARAATIAAEAMAVAKRIGHPHGLAWATAAEAIGRFCTARWKPARIVSEEALALFREHCADVGWEVGSMEMWWWLPAMRWLGDYAPVIRRAASCAKEAAERGDLYTNTGVRTHVLPHVHLMNDRPDDARQEGEEAVREWSRDLWLTQHWCNALTQAQTALYAMRLGEAREGVERDSKRIDRSLQSRLQTMRVQFLDVRARVMVAAAREDKARRKALLSDVDRCVSRLGKEELPWAEALGVAAQGGAAFVRGDLERARASYGRAARLFTELDMSVHALAAQARLATVEGGEAGRMTRVECLAEIGERGVKRPERFAEMLVP